MSDWTHFSGSRALIARLASLSVFVILGALVYFSMGPTDGQKQIDRTLEALKKVHSWRRRAVLRNSSSIQTELSESSCPLNSRRTIIVESPTAPKIQMDSLRIGSQSYERANDGPWKLVTLPTSNTCVDASKVMDLSYVPIKLLREHGLIKKGDKRLVDGVKCRDWSIAIQVVGQPSESYTVCIDSDDLPREIRSTHDEYVVSLTDFNSPIILTAPELPPSEPAAPSSTEDQ